MASALSQSSIMEGACLSKLNVSKKGAKSASVFSKKGDIHVDFGLKGHALRAPFNPSTFDKDTEALRQNICFETTEELEHWAQEFDAWAINIAHQNSMELFKKQMTREQIAEAYTSPLRGTENQVPMLKCKINMPSHARPCRFWSEQQKLIDHPLDWRLNTYKVRLRVSHLWIMGSNAKPEFGFCLLLEDAIVLEPKFEFPFPDHAFGQPENCQMET